ncbi:MAG TPA: DUF4148 domain-containing protein [Ramlibacter sp.]|uniref:DUF4148 domain-containing protein n=1 Tax=Ramlibacter sp. TaxID=1917967 RepID=UPI002ED37F35
MNRKIALALALAAAGTAAHADEITVDPFPFKSTLSRAEVMADLMQHRRSGIDTQADDYNPLAQFRGAKTRADVRAEFMAERDTVAAMTREDSGSAYLARVKPALARETQLARSQDDASN